MPVAPDDPPEVTRGSVVVATGEGRLERWQAGRVQAWVRWRFGLGVSLLGMQVMVRLRRWRCMAQREEKNDAITFIYHLVLH